MRNPIRLLVLDVDGVLTDGRLYFGPRGEALKVFHVRDGLGLVQLRRAGVAIAVISGRRSPMVTVRCRELGIEHVYQGIADKLAVFARLCARLQITPAACACIGDDLPDLPLLRAVARGFAVADAHPQVRRAAGHITRLPGGAGAVREVCDLLLETRRAAEAPAVIYRLLAILAFVALVVGAVVLSDSQRQSAAQVTVEEAMPDPGYSARKAHMVQTAADGHPLYTLDAAQVQQQPGQETVTLQQVQFAFRDDGGNQWTARANQGELSQTTGIVKLSGAVHVNGVLPGADEPADLSTEHLAFDTKAQVLTTADPVTLVMSGRKLDATGMSANLKESRVQLESAVHGTYLP